MKITLEKVLGSHAQLKELSTTKLNGVTAFEIHKLLNQLDEHLRNFDKVRLQKAAQYGTLDQKGTYQFEGENADLFKAELDALLKQEIDVVDCQLAPSLFFNIDISPGVFSQLDWLIKEEKNVDKSAASQDKAPA